ncbi:MAG: HAD family hydrolase [Promethearchaeota archaeon]|nr:MAG: HAD family hydrolase [Candidatus Lokiarchaeota archaeon]
MIQENNQLVKWLEENKLKAIIFDFDGVLLDIREPLERSIKEVFEKNDIEVDLDKSIQEIGGVLESVQGFPMPKIILESHNIFRFITTLEDISFLKKLKLATEIFTKYLEYEKDAELFPEAYLLIEQLSKSYDLYIVSHNQSKNLENHLNKKNISQFFKGVFGADNLPELKPSPAALQPVLSKYTPLHRNEFLIIGDMPTDIEAGQEAGIWTVAISSGISNKEILSNYRPELLLDSLTQLLELFRIEYTKKAISKAKKSIKIY